MRPVPLVMAAMVALPAAAQEDPDFATCMDLEVAGFERALDRARRAGETSFEIGDVSGVEFCGTSGIVDCDRSAEPLDCQHALAAEQEALRWKVLATLPTPPEAAGSDAEAPDALFLALHNLAHDLSAGPDCDGHTPVMTAWCEAREANRRLMSAVLAWQMARWMDVAPDAVTAGWARPSPPTRPVPRPQEP